MTTTNSITFAIEAPAAQDMEMKHVPLHSDDEDPDAPGPVAEAKEGRPGKMIWQGSTWDACPWFCGCCAPVRSYQGKHQTCVAATLPRRLLQFHCTSGGPSPPVTTVSFPASVPMAASHKLPTSHIWQRRKRLQCVYTSSACQIQPLHVHMPLSTTCLHTNTHRPPRSVSAGKRCELTQ